MLGKRLRWCLVVAVVISGIAMGGAVPTAAAVRSSSGPSAPPLPDLRRAETWRALGSGASGPIQHSQPHTNVGCTVLFTAIPSGNVTTFKDRKSTRLNSSHSS